MSNIISFLRIINLKKRSRYCEDGILNYYDEKYGTKISDIFLKDEKDEKVYIDSSIFIEYTILSQLNHQNIIECPEIKVKNMEIRYKIKSYWSDLHTWSKYRYKEELKYYFTIIFSKVCDGLQFLHSNNIVHGDLKPSNIVKDGLNVSLIDFGNSIIGKVDGNKITYSRNYSTPVFRSPEALQNKYFGPENDIWSLGMTMYFYFREDYSKFYNLSEEELIEYFSENTVKCSKNNKFSNIINSCLNPDYTKRPNIYQVLEMLNPKYKVNKGEIINTNSEKGKQWYEIYNNEFISEVIHTPCYYEEIDKNNILNVFNNIQDEIMCI